MCRQSLIETLMRRDGLSRIEARALIDEARERIAEGDPPDEVLLDDLGLEEDYLPDIFDDDA